MKNSEAGSAAKSLEARTVLVIGDPTATHMKVLDKLPPETTITVGKAADAFERTVAATDIIVNSIGKHEPLRTLFLKAPRVRWVHSLSAGLDGVLFDELVKSDIPVTNSRGVYSRSLAEFAIASILYFAKDFARMLRNKRERKWEQFDVEEIHGQTLCVVGYGDIGRATAERAHALGMRVVAVRRRPQLSEGDSIVDAVHPMENRREALATADYVVVSPPLTPDTRGLVGEAELRAMKPTSVIVNLGRGPVIAEDALVQALREGWIRGAALDVFDKEPLPETHAFWGMENVFISPHCADHTATWLFDAMELFIANFERFTAGEPLVNVVDKHAGY